MSRHVIVIERGLATFEVIARSTRDALAQSRELYVEQHGRHEVPIGRVLTVDGESACDGHPAGPFDPMGQTVYCDGTCQR